MIEILFLSALLVAGGASYGLWYWRRQARAAQARLRETPSVPDPRERERIAAEERAKIFRDLHDDIGVKLLALLHTVGDVRHADLVRSIIYDLRDIVSRSRRPPGTLLEVLAQIRDEMEQRLEAFNVELGWRQDPATPDVAVVGASALNLFRIMREAVTNAIRHAGASTIAVNIACRERQLVFEIANDRPGPRRPTPAGSGTLGMQERAASLGGSVRWLNESSGGVKVVLEVPLDSLQAVT
ncbi:ATP-binding protein [Fontimonas sp. SYSU GA230001]|uniref:sensor histidine kinase n=1 Tax=Fontimonas sp. SYSU GA230001 TaxID=3142450 RepID=UPI0032B3405B